MSEKKTLIGDDSMIFTGDPGETEYHGDDIETINSLIADEPKADGISRIMCLITAIAPEDSIFPDGLKAGEIFPAMGTGCQKKATSSACLSFPTWPTHRAGASASPRARSM